MTAAANALFEEQRAKRVAAERARRDAAVAAAVAGGAPEAEVRAAVRQAGRLHPVALPHPVQGTPYVQPCACAHHPALTH